jgi:hypothetical protein
VEVRVRSQASPCDIRGGHSGTVISLPPCTSVFPFPCHCHSTIAPHLQVPVSAIPPLLHIYKSLSVPLHQFSTHLQLRVAVTKRTNRRSLRTFQKAILFQKPESAGWKINFTFESLKGTLHIFFVMRLRPCCPPC